MGEGTEYEVQTLPSTADELEALLERLPPAIRRDVDEQSDADSLLEVVLDLGRLPEARFAERNIYLGSEQVTQEDIQYVVGRISPFRDDNRAGIERTLHRISAVRNRAGKIVGLTCRVGRAVLGTIRVVEDLVTSGKSILLLGRPGVGKTTMLREAARVLADTAGKRVVIVDTSNEIAGDGDIPHAAIGRSRRMQVPTPTLQHGVMIEAVENHMPEVIIIDEMGTAEEAVAARTIAERGVQLIATAHGNTLENLLVNPTLSDLLGGVQTVTLGDEEARRRRTQKTILERKAPPTFEVLVEIQSWNRVAVHVDVARTVDRLLRGQPPAPEVRWLDKSGSICRAIEGRAAPAVAAGMAPSTPASVVSPGVTPAAAGVEKPGHGRIPRVHVHPFGVTRERLEQAAQAVRVSIQMVDALADADLVLTTKSHFRRRPPLLRDAEELGKPVFVLRRNTAAQIRSFLHEVTAAPGGGNGLFPGSWERGAAEATAGVERILSGRASSAELSPQTAEVRRAQHQVAEAARLHSRSAGREPRRRVTIYRDSS